MDNSWLGPGAHGRPDPEGTPATPSTGYPIAGVMKLHTAAVILRLVEKGDLRLGDRMVDLLADEVTDRLHVLDGVDRTDETPQPVGDRRRKGRYADTNYQLLGAVAGRPLAELFEQTRFGPLDLGATSSYPHAPRSGASPLPDARVWSKDVVLQVDGALRFQTPDGGIDSILDDQLRFMQALAGGEIFDDPATWDEMQQPRTPVFFPVDYGLGVMRYAHHTGCPRSSGTADRRPQWGHRHLAVPLPRPGRRRGGRLRRRSASPPLPVPAPSPPRYQQ